MELAFLRLEKNSLETLIKKKDEKILGYEAENERLREIILGLKRQAFGPKKERWISDKQEGLLFNEAEIESKKEEPEISEENSQSEAPENKGDQIQVSGFVCQRGKRKPLPENLPRTVVTVELPESERVDETGAPLKAIGKEVSEKLVYEPARIEVIEYHRIRYGRDSGDPVKTAPPVPSVIPKGIATPSLLSGIITNKYADGLPLYRQEEIFNRHGVDLSRNSMARWVIQSAQASQPIWNILEDRLLGSKYVSCDETPVQVLKEDGRKAESKSWMWVRSTPGDKQKIVLFDYDPHRSGQVAKRILADYQGFLQVDGYGAYNWTENIEGITRLGCNMHGRRGYEEAFRHGSKGGRPLAEQALKYYQRLYELEEEAKKKGMTWEERYEFRKLHSAPLWDEMKSWAEAQQQKVPPKSKIGEAFGYFLGEYDRLRGYLQHGMLEMDNGFAERSIRKFAIGRNNWLFSDTEDGANASAMFYSFVVTAKVNGVNPYEALKTIFEKLPLAKTVEDYEQLADLLLFPAQAN